MKVPLSSRLLTCCNYVNQGDRVADIGCDHGYLGIHLLKTGVAQSVIAADINEQPLHSATVNATKFGVRDKMRFFLSNGAVSIPRDFDTMVCAGMGADTMISILTAAPWLKNEQYRLILQCQSKTPMLRRFLQEQGWRIRREALAKDGKFVYSVMEVIFETPEATGLWEYYISKALLEEASPLLREYYDRILHGLRLNVEGMRRSGSQELTLYEETLSQLEALEEKINEYSG
jgi:tRNA (adenine22-N1)-methyltransferase